MRCLALPCFVLAWLGFAWLGFAWLCLALLLSRSRVHSRSWVHGFMGSWVHGFVVLGFALLGFAWLGSAWLCLVLLGFAWLGLASLVHRDKGFSNPHISFSSIAVSFRRSKSVRINLAKAMANRLFSTDSMTSRKMLPAMNNNDYTNKYND